MNTEYYTDTNGNNKTADFSHYDGTRHALLCAMIREAENRTYCAPLHEETPEAKAAARAIWQTFNYLVQIINELEYIDGEHTQRAAAYEEATEAEEHAYNYNTAHMSENSATAEYEARDNLDETQRKAAEFVMEDVTPRNIEVSNAAAYYRYTITDTEPYIKPMKQNKAF